VAGVLAALTARQLAFVRGKVAGLSDRRAALEAGYAESTAENTAQKILCRPRVREAFLVLLERACPSVELVDRIRAGLDATRRLVAGRGVVVEVPDWTERRLYLELVLRLRGLIPRAGSGLTGGVALVGGGDQKPV
jgi:hypothetical protein